MSREWTDSDADLCGCRGLGWAEVDLDVWKECPCHFNGQLHPHSLALLLDEPTLMQEEERKASLYFKIREKRLLIQELQKKIRGEQDSILKLELELIKVTPTVKMQAVQIHTDEIELLEGDFI